MNYIYAGLTWLLMAGVPVILILADVVLIAKKKEKLWFEMLAFSVGTVYMLFAYILWDLPDYDSPLNVYGGASAHAPVNVEYLGVLALYAVWGFVSYLLLKYSKKKLSPVIESVLLAGTYIGIVLSGVWMIQLWGGAKPQGIENKILFGDETAEGMYTFALDWSDYLMILALCIVPAFFIIHSIRLLITLIKEKAIVQQDLIYENSLLKKVNHLFCKGARVFWLAFIAILPVLGILVLILILFGQQPDSVILAFTKTSDWILSGEISPPPVAYDTHYLCTVSLRGHKKLVKPTRFGLRRGEKIVVNRQLCVANAFEQLIEERAPRFHRAVRTFYDTYGYPVSKHINSAWSADVVYLLMKPLEWIFVFVLYLFDEKPEDRIGRQYLPKEIIVMGKEKVGKTQGGLYEI